MNKIEIENLHFNYSSKKILKNITLKAELGELTGLIGPNGAGKSTLLKCIAGILKPKKGKIKIKGKNIHEISKKELSQILSYQPQNQNTSAALPVLEAVLLGKVHTLSWNISQQDLQEAWNILQKLEIEHLAEKNLNELSGGQQQMINMAQSMIGTPDTYLLDEPTSNLDLPNQLKVMEIIKKITHNENITTIITSHDLNQISRYADNLIILKNGEIYSTGKPKNVITKKMMNSVYNVKSKIEIDEENKPKITPLKALKKG
ncbi:ABC transporter ATP-binding protein [Methanonatronarchaeum sp. AMET-Sl]|uniref:ABC transporter ATP-binding protein n=1 Tax=Methanonatronarchaeum sp. AMET-Sl TaxID=3037654 RepID=UPI00244E2741|nr:ABC transporter ATP-binding protein [Methanonatronarchaeum sp. AMET-Sl]WGI17971.1 ABC transporter ATP-binding protein [Methanonatronarchaeum sp. AMET-Sl]